MIKAIPSDVKLACELFVYFDKDKNNKISFQELKTGLRAVTDHNPTEKELDEITRDLGVTKDQTITEEQFHQCIYKYLDKFRNTTPEKEANTIKEAFEFFDKNHDGIINRKELKNILLITEKGKTTKEIEKEVDEMIKQVDTNKDGNVSYEEFVKLWTKSPSKSTVTPSKPSKPATKK